MSFDHKKITSELVNTKISNGSAGAGAVFTRYSNELNSMNSIKVIFHSHFIEMAVFIGSPPVTAMSLIVSWTIGFRIVFTLNFAYNKICPDVVTHTMAASLESTIAIE